MCDSMEILFVSDICENNQISCSAWDYKTGTNLMNYKGGGNLCERSFCIIKSNYVVGASDTKPLMYVWPINSQELVTSIRFVLPGKVNCLSISPDGLYLVAGIQENIYIWHLNSGRLLTTISKHFQPINSIKFVDDSSHFVTAGQDGTLLVWNLTQVLSKEDNCDNALYSLNDHGLSITEVFVGKGGMRSFLYTVSLDRTCKAYDLSNGLLLLNIVFPDALCSFVINAIESNAYVGTENGNIYEVNFDDLPRTKECNVSEDFSNKFLGHEHGTKVNCLSLSLDGQTLISGGQDKNVYIWHIPSRQLLKQMSFKGKISNLELRLSNPAIFQPQHKQPPYFFGNLKRMVETNDDIEIEILITDQMNEFSNKNISEKQNSKTSISKIGSLEQTEKIEQLEAEIERLKYVNREIFALSAKTILRRSSGKPNTED